jgi:hypothetical protein
MIAERKWKNYNSEDFPPGKDNLCGDAQANGFA